MKTKVNICNEEWCNLVFEGKNKEYGAFAIRTHAPQQRAKSLLITIFLAISIAALPLLKKKIIPPAIDQGGDFPITLAPVTVDPPKPINIDPPQASKPIRPMIRFTVPVVGTDNSSDQLPTNEDLFNRKILIGPVNVKGDENVDYPADLDKRITGEGKKDEIFIIVEKPPQYVGGLEELQKFLKKNLNYPETAKDNGISGRVYAQFVVDKNGDIKNIKIVRGLDNSCNEEAIRVLKLMPRWKPGMQNGNNVSVYFTLPIVFSLSHQ